jgi:putative transposase
LYAWIAQNRGTASVAFCCRVLSVRREGYYVWQKRLSRPDRDGALISALKDLRAQHPSYGVRSLRDGLPVTVGKPSYGKCYTLCRDNGLLQRRRKPHSITRRNFKDQLSEDLIKRDFTAAEANTKWLSDITEMKCKDGKLYVAAILDCFDGAIVGLSMAAHKRADLCVSTLNSAVGRYGKRPGLIIHSDRGSEYTSHKYRQALQKYKLLQSMGRTGSCYDNARMESFFATLKKELIYKLPLYKLSRQQVRQQIFVWIELYYNTERRYTANEGNLPPLKKRAMNQAQLAA